MKNLLLITACFFSLFCYSQKIIKKITNTPNSTIVDVYRFRNGNSGNVIGPKGFNENLSDGGAFSFYTPNNNLYFQYTLNCNQVECNLPISDEQICNGVFKNVVATNFINSNYYAFDNNNVQHFFDIPTKILETERDEINDGNNNIDLLHTQFEIPKKMNDNSFVPINTWVVLFIGNAVDLDLVIGNNGVESYIFSGKKIVLKFDGKDWIEQNHDWLNNFIEPITSECGELIIEHNINFSKFDIYPNPTSDLVCIKSNIPNNTKYEYIILDMNGKTVQVGNAKLEEYINIEKLIMGNYIIQIIKDGNLLESKKIIKK